MLLAGEAGSAAETATRRVEEAGGRRDLPAITTDEMSDAAAAFHSRTTAGPVIYDLAVAARRTRPRSSDLSPRSSPSTSGALPASSSRTVASSDAAEQHVEHQAREFELLKPYLVEHWGEVVS
jgi:hypothetical protein